MKLILTLLALTIATISAQVNIISVTSPLTSTVYTAGQTVTISWINPTVDTISVIVLAKGSPSALEPISTIAENVDAKAGIFAWNIPADIPAGEDYALEFGTSPDMSFAGLFTIKNDANAQPSATSIGPVINSESPSSVSSSGPEPSSAAVSASTTHTQVISERAANVTESSAASASQTDAFGNSASTDSREPLSKVAMGAISLIGVIAVALA